LEDLDPADVLRLDVGLVGDRADDVARLHAVVVADLDAEGLHAGLRRPRHALLLREGRALGALAAVAAPRALAEAALVAEGRCRPGLALRRLQQQRHVAARHLRQRGRDLDRRYVLLALVVLDQRL